MAKLENITVGSSVKGIAGNEAVTIVAVQWYGTNVIDITYRNSQNVSGQQLLYREDESRIEVMDKNLPWSFDANGDQLKLASEAYRISLAHLFDPYLAVHTSSVEPLPHQISAVYKEMLPRLPLRYVLADDPGAGKTIMTGLFIKELIARGDLKRCLIVSPGSLAEQWQDELYSKFHIRFEILTNDRMESAVSGNVFSEVDLCIARLDKLARSDELQEKLKVTEWDLIVCDEAHKMAATVWGGEVKYTKRFLLGRLLSNITRNFLLLTATPHNGKEEDFQMFLSLVDPDRFEGIHSTSQKAVDVSDVMRRLVKEELLKFDGKPLFPERIAYTVNYDLSPEEAKLYAEVTDYVREEFNRADNLNNEHKTTVGFALTILQRRLASSPEAIYQSEQVITNWAPALLQMCLDDLLWKDANDISVKKLWEYLSTYCYLPRLANYAVLEDTIRRGVNSNEFFALAAGYTNDRYVDLKFDTTIMGINLSDLLVKTGVALKQMVAEKPKATSTDIPFNQGGGSSTTDPSGFENEGSGAGSSEGNSGGTQPKAASNKHFFMSAKLDNTRVNRDVQNYLQEIIQHLVAVDGSHVELTLEVELTAPDGIPNSTVRTVSENCRTLKVTDFGFDE